MPNAVYVTCEKSKMGVMWTTGVFLAGAVAIILSVLTLRNSTVVANELRTAAQLTPSMTMYVNSVSGNDDNSGTTATDPVATLARALLNFDTETVTDCVVVLLETLRLADTDPVISLFPTIRQCQRISITAPRTVLHSDVVTVTTAVNPNSYNWTQVQLQTGGLVAGTLAGLFVENTSQGRVYVIESNTNNTLIAIAGYIDPSAAVKSFTSAETDAWHVGDHMELFTLDVAIEWSGTLLFDIPYNEVRFSNLKFVPLSDGSVARFTDGMSQITLQGCDLGARGLSMNNASYMGYAAMYGVHCHNTATSALQVYFMAWDTIRCVHMESVLLSEIGTIRIGVCSALFLKAENSVSATMSISSVAQQVLYSLKLIQTEVSAGIITIVGATASVIFDGVYMDKSGVSTVTRAISTDVTSMIVIRDLELICSLPSCTEAILVGKNCRMILSGHIRIIASRVVNSLPYAQLHVNDPDSIVITGLTNASPFTFTAGMSVTFTVHRTAFVLTKTAATVNGIMLCQGCRLTLEGNRTNYLWSTPAGTPLLRAQLGGRIVDRTSGGGMSVQGNQGSSPGSVIRCGAGAIYNWATSQFSASDNSMCTAAM